MKRKKLIIILSAVLATLIIGGVVVYAASYDSTSDPLVALSYITNVFKPSVDKDIKSVGDKVTSAESRISSIEKAIANGTIGGTVDTAEIDGRLDALESSAALSAADVKSIKTQLESAKSELSEAKAQLESISADSVTKSELQSEVSNLSATIAEQSTKIDALSAAIEAQSSNVDTLISTYSALLEALLEKAEPTEENYGYKTVTLSKGEKISAAASCSVMMRAGEGTYTFSGEGYDATASSSIASGSSAKTEHIVVFDTGVVFEAVSDTAVIMIKGDYTVER